MIINELKNKACVLCEKEQAKVKGGTDQMNAVDSIIIGDIDSF